MTQKVRLQHVKKYKTTDSVGGSSEVFKSHELWQPALDLPVDWNVAPRVLEERPELLQTIQMTCRTFHALDLQGGHSPVIIKFPHFSRHFKWIFMEYRPLQQ